MQMQMKLFDKVLFCMLGFTGILIADIPQRLPVGTPEPPLIEKTRVIEGHYLVQSDTYKSTAFIKQAPDTTIFIVYQYTGATVLKGIGFMDNDRFVIGWEQDKTVGASTIRFRDGKGRASWASNPGNGQVNHETWSLIDDQD